MARDRRTDDSERSGPPGDGDPLHRTIEPDPERAGMELVDLIARLEDTAHDELPPLYNCIDNMVGRLYEDPPPADAAVELAFRYAGYWIKLDQAGNVVLQQRDAQ